MLRFLITRLVLLQLLPCLFLNVLHSQTSLSKPNGELIKKIKSVEGLVSFWKFDEKPGRERKSSVMEKYPLQESNGIVTRINEGPLSGFSILFDGTNYLTLDHSQTGKLNIFGDQSEITLVAWIKWTGEQTGFVGGIRIS